MRWHRPRLAAPEAGVGAGRLDRLRRWPVPALGALSEGYRLAGQLAEARSTAGRMLELARATGHRHSEAAALRLLGEVHARTNPVEAVQAEESYREALTIAQQLEARPLAARCRLGLGMLYRRTDRRQEAQDHISTAATMFREMGMTYWLEQAE